MLFSTEEELEAFGEELGRELAQGKGPRVLALQGELGAGKTTFTRGLARGLGIGQNITSPTFVLAKAYDLPQGGTFWHVDTYRLQGPEDLETFDFAGMHQDPRNVVVVEWAEKISEALPKKVRWISFSHHDEGRTVETDGENENTGE